MRLTSISLFRLIFGGSPSLKHHGTILISSPFFQEHQPKYWIDIIKSHDARTPIITAFEIACADDRFVARIGLDHIIHYQFSFAFRELSVKRRRGRSVLVDENRSLFEHIDNKCIFNFYEPFYDDC